MNSQTPRTDAAMTRPVINGVRFRTVSALAYELERELAAVTAERDRLREALSDIQTWCENAQASTGIKPYGLDIARAALVSP